MALFDADDFLVDAWSWMVKKLMTLGVTLGATLGLTLGVTLGGSLGMHIGGLTGWWWVAGNG